MLAITSREGQEGSEEHPSQKRFGASLAQEDTRVRKRWADKAFLFPKEGR